MSDQNRFDEYKQKLLHYWSVFLAACGKLWETAKSKVKAAAVFLSRNGKVLLQKLAAWTLKAREWLKKTWAAARKKGRKLLQKLAAWALEIREKVQPMIQRAGEWIGALTARFQRPKTEEPEALPAAQEAPVLPEPEQVVEETALVEAPVEAAQEPVCEEAVEEVPVETETETSDPVLAVCGRYVKLTLKWLWRLRSVFMAIPVVWAAIKLAMQNMDRLPEQVGLDIQATGEFARMISRQEAVYWPLGITLFCVVLMFFSKKPLLPWVISIFTLVLPWLIWLLNYYA